MSTQLTLDMTHDAPRLETLNSLVLGVMECPRIYLTLAEIRTRCGRGSEAGISARIRDLRNKYGYEISKRRRGLAAHGLWEYRLEGKS